MGKQGRYTLLHRDLLRRDDVIGGVTSQHPHVTLQRGPSFHGKFRSLYAHQAYLQ